MANRIMFLSDEEYQEHCDKVRKEELEAYCPEYSECMSVHEYGILCFRKGQEVGK